jgi:hypothetical protein
VHYAGLFKPTLNELEPEERARYAPLFQHNEGIYRYFMHHVLDVIDYEEGTRRAPVGICAKNAMQPMRNNTRDFDIFSHYVIVTDVPVIGTSRDEREEKARAFIRAIQYLLKPCLINFEVVHEKDKTLIRTDMDTITFSILGVIVTTAAFLELTTEELVTRMREGQARLWQNERARELGRIGLPGTFEMAIMGIPGVSFRQNMCFNKDGVLIATDDVPFDHSNKKQFQRTIFPDLMYDTAGKRVLETTISKSPDGRNVHTLSPVEHVKTEGHKKLKETFTLQGTFSAVSKAVSSGGASVLSNAGSVAFSAILKGLTPGWQAYNSKKTWDGMMNEMWSHYQKSERARAKEL